MKIFGSVNEINKVSRTDGVKKTQATKKLDRKADEILISNSAKDYHVAMKALKNVPDIRADKVAEAQVKMSKGAYDRVDEAMVEKFINQCFDQRI